MACRAVPEPLIPRATGRFCVGHLLKLWSLHGEERHVSEPTSHICPECSTPRASDGTPSCACGRRASEALLETRTAEAAAAEDFDPLRIRPYVELGEERDGHDGRDGSAVAAGDGRGPDRTSTIAMPMTTAATTAATAATTTATTAPWPDPTDTRAFGDGVRARAGRDSTCGARRVQLVRPVRQVRRVHRVRRVRRVRRVHGVRRTPPLRPGHCSRHRRRSHRRGPPRRTPPRGTPYVVGDAAGRGSPSSWPVPPPRG